MKKILLMNGPNLNMLGIREPGVYGNDTLKDLEAGFCEYAGAHGCEVECFQSNHEGDLVDKIHATHAGAMTEIWRNASRVLTSEMCTSTHGVLTLPRASRSA